MKTETTFSNLSLRRRGGGRTESWSFLGLCPSVHLRMQLGFPYDKITNRKAFKPHYLACDILIIAWRKCRGIAELGLELHTDIN